MAEIKGSPRIIEEDMTIDYWHIYYKIDISKEYEGTPERPAIVVLTIESDQEGPETKEQLGAPGDFEYFTTLNHKPTDEEMEQIYQEIENKSK